MKTVPMGIGTVSSLNVHKTSPARLLIINSNLS